MTLTHAIPIVILVAALAALVFLLYRDKASLTGEEKKRLLAERAAAADGGSIQTIDALMPALISIVVLLTSIYIILSAGYGDGASKFAFGSVGTILGYWLRPVAKIAARGGKRT